MTQTFTAAIDEATGCAVVHDETGEIRLIVPNGKIRIERFGTECSECIAGGLAFAERIADALAPFNPYRCHGTVSHVLGTQGSES